MWYQLYFIPLELHIASRENFNPIILALSRLYSSESLMFSSVSFCSFLLDIFLSSWSFAAALSFSSWSLTAADSSFLVLDIWCCDIWYYVHVWLDMSTFSTPHSSILIYVVNARLGCIGKQQQHDVYCWCLLFVVMSSCQEVSPYLLTNHISRHTPNLLKYSNLYQIIICLSMPRCPKPSVQLSINIYADYILLISLVSNW